MSITRDGLVEALRLHRSEIVEADEWRPLADHVLELARYGILGEPESAFLASREPASDPCSGGDACWCTACRPHREPASPAKSTAEYVADADRAMDAAARDYESDDDDDDAEPAKEPR